MQYKNKKNLYKIVFITILLGLIISLAGSNWLSFGLLNIFDPQAQIRVNYTDIDLTEGECTIALEIYSLNEVEFIGTGFKYEYYNGTTKISSLSKMVGATFYVAPSILPGTPGPTTTIDLPLYYQEAQDYVTSNPLITEITCTISLIGTDGAGHNITKSVTFDLPALQPGIDFEPPKAYFDVMPGTTGTAPFTVVFDASSSTDDRGIASYSWNFGDGNTGTGVLVSHTYVDSGSYIIILTVTDYYGNKGYYTEVITVGDEAAIGAPIAKIQVTPSATGIAPFTVAFDASGSYVNSGCGSCIITNYSWNFGDGSTGTGIATTHTYVSAGIYITILTVTDSNGKVGYATVVITVTSEEEPTVETITVNANPESNVPGGTSTISAIVTNSDGDFVPNGTTVYFYTNSGVLSADSDNTTNGIATVDLTLDDNMQGGETAKVTAFIGSKTGYVDVKCIDVIITIYADKYSVIPGGISTITAVVTDTVGKPVVDGIIVIFFTTKGDLSLVNNATISGIATTTLTLSTTGDTATVTAKCGSRVSNPIVITCEAP